jgi:CRISPR/Cas system-associated exonuclease Cas4 (RecB family)
VKSFLQHIVDDIGSQDKDLLKSRCYVFPSRRACIYFNDLLQEKFARQVIWAPTVISIDEFVQQQTPELTVVDDIRLLFKLYEINKKEVPSLTFDTFYAWGLTLLKDFDEIDRYLVDAKLIYQNLQEIENIEEAFGPGEDLIKAIKGLQKIIGTDGEGKLYRAFNKTWTTIGKVYQQFRSELMENGWAYNGLCYRLLAEKLEQGLTELPYSQIIFAGFNALSKAEQEIINSLLSINMARVYFDADEYYVDDEQEEAGYFLRKMRKQWQKNKQVKWVFADGFKQPKLINIIGVSQKTAQARAAATCLGKMTPQSSKTAVVLADESILLPVLYALPPQDTNLNITMGYPIGGTSTGNLLKAFCRYHASVSINNDGAAFFDLNALTNLLSQSAIRSLVSNEMLLLRQSKSRYVGWQVISAKIAGAEAKHHNLLNRLFSPVTDVKEAIENISNIILEHYLLSKNDETVHDILEERVIYSVANYLQNLLTIVTESKLNISLVTLEKVINESLRTIKTPFTGEPLAGLQVMGFLETRTLDFDNLIILSVNEDLLPAASNARTYIPFAIRKAFHLPTFLEHNSLYAYHFFRLLQRAGNISLIYNTQLSVTGTGEKSRYIRQLLNRFYGKNTPVKIEHINLLPQLSTKEITRPPIIYKKTGPVLKHLEDHINSFTQAKPLTPTSLVDYITCSLKYYFARILRIRAPEELSADIDARIFGNILHDILETAYLPWLGKEITRAEIDDLIKNKLPEIIESAFTGYDKNSGEISFTRHVISYLVKRILQNDSKDAPLRIIDLESKSTPLLYELLLANKKTIPLGGKIDRLDQINLNGRQVTRVLDYKTGKVELKNKKYYQQELSIEDYMKAYFIDPKYKSGFQIYFYILLQKRNFPEQEITGGILGVKKLSKGIDYLREEASPLAKEIINAFEQNLIWLMEELLDTNIPFRQTEDTDRCRYCDFKSICGR